MYKRDNDKFLFYLIHFEDKKMQLAKDYFL